MLPRLTALLLCATVACSSKPEPAASSPDANAAPSADAKGDSKALLAQVDQLSEQFKDKPKTFEVLAALGNLYYENNRFLDAIDSYRQALELSAPAEAQAQDLRKAGTKPAKDLPLECRRSGPTYGLEQIVAAAKSLDAPRRLRCLDAALEVALAIRARRANALYLVGNPDGALAEHHKLLAQSPDYPESLFFVGAVTLEQSRGDKKKLEEGKKYWKRLLAVAPDHPRAELVRQSLPKADEIFAKKATEVASAGALGQGRPVPPNHPPVAGNDPAAPMAHSGAPSDRVDPAALAAVEDAVKNTERTPELEKGLDDLTAQAEKLLDQDKYQEARDAIVRVMPMRPGDARTAAVLGGAMRGLGRTEMAQRTLSVALQNDPKQPRALYEMGKLKASSGDKAGAAASFQSLQTADPKFARAHGVDEQLARLK
ncbi:MAG: tetratricopeptide repeat protein [Myxococcales bacterium]